jgi:hypothetical protein
MVPMIDVNELPAVERLHQRIKIEVEQCEHYKPQVLDVGAGLATYHTWLRNICELHALDAHAPYLNPCRSDLQGVNRIVADATAFFPIEANSFDCILAIDFIEHLEKKVALQLIIDFQMAANKVVIFTPEGHYPQNQDAYGMGADHWQTHRSEWCASDLESLGFKVEVWEGFHGSWNSHCDPNALWATWNY